MDVFKTKVQYVKGVGPKRAELLKKLGITSLSDLIYYFPKDYDDRTQLTTLRDSNIGEKVNLEIEILEAGKIYRVRNNLSILKVPFKDSTGYGYLTWFNQNYLNSRFKPGEKYRISGKVTRNGYDKSISNPEFEKSDYSSARIFPIYSSTKGLSNNKLINIINNAIESYIDFFEEALPLEIREKYNLIGIKEALKNIHFPKDQSMINKSRKRLIFEELFLLQLGLLSIKKQSFKEEKGINFPRNKEESMFIEGLDFELTKAQKKVLSEINYDMDSKYPMNRLVQGDVGSGKTIVATIALLRCIKSGYQAAMMAPTEILARQHFESINKAFNEWGIRTELLVGSLKEKEKLSILTDLESGKIDMIIGTHAIIQDRISFKNLGLVITDEQHRFGVKQRANLSLKGKNPDILVMTATPIPRTLALIFYGDLDISIIDELPPGRKEIETICIREELIPRMNNFIKTNIKEGRQAYIVCPLIDESETMDLSSAEELYMTLKEGVFKEFKLGLLHGKMRPKEKDEIMNQFKKNQINILVSTTVIEVGVNVPNASIMVIYNAERFGLAQLHQLRGRVGRGEYQSYCILINYSVSQTAMERMRILQASSDGFLISEKDLEMRGPGEFFGERQHGLPELKISNLLTDMKILKIVQKEALKIIKDDKYIGLHNHNLLQKRISCLFKNGNDTFLIN